MTMRQNLSHHDIYTKAVNYIANLVGSGNLGATWAQWMNKNGGWSIEGQQVRVEWDDVKAAIAFKIASEPAILATDTTPKPSSLFWAVWEKAS